LSTYSETPPDVESMALNAGETRAVWRGEAAGVPLDPDIGRLGRWWEEFR